MVDVRIEALDNDAAAARDYYVAVRIGETHKVSRMCGAKEFRFQQDALRDKKFGKVEILKRVGSSRIRVQDVDSVDAQEVNVSCDGDGSDFRFCVAVNQIDDERPGQRTAKPPAKAKDEVMLDAKNYLNEHNLEFRMADAVRAVLHERPANPGKFIAARLIQSEDDSLEEKPATLPAEPARSDGESTRDSATAPVEQAVDESYGASHTSCYTDAVRKDRYFTLSEILVEKMVDKDLVQVVNSMFDSFGTITEALRKELVTVADKQSSVFGDVQLGVDVIADELLWDTCKCNPLIKEGASEEAPDVRETHVDGKYSICWDPLDGSSIVDNNWAVGTIVGIWPASTGVIGASGRDQVTSMVALYGPRTTAFIALDDGVYEFTYGANGAEGWLCSRERIQILPDSKIFAPANMRVAQEVEGYNKLIHHWMEKRRTLRYTGGLVPDVCQQFTKGMGIFTNPTSSKSPAKLRLAFEAAPFALLVEKAGGKTSNGVDGKSVLDTTIVGIDQRTALAIGSANEVDRFNEIVLNVGGFNESEHVQEH